MAGAPAGSGRRGDSPATYRRRRLVALGVLAALAALLLSLIDGGGTDAPRSAREVISREREQEPVRLTVSVSGDLLIHSQIYGRAQALGGGGGYDFAPLFKQVRPFVRGADLAVCHVETPMGPGEPTSYPLFNTPPSLAEAIAKTGWEACDTASNHSLDQGQDGIDNTLSALDDAGVEHTGSYASKKASRSILMLGAKGVRIAYISYTTDTNGIPVPNPWSLNVTQKPGAVIADARRARRKGADVVLVNMQWGINMSPEYVTKPSKRQVAFVKALAAAPQITAVVGQGPHVVQRIDRLKGKIAVFSEGNLISGQGADVALAAESQDGFIGLLDLVVDGEGARVRRVRYVPTLVDRPNYTVLPVGRALRRDEGDAASLRESYERTVDAAGRGSRIEPQPRKLR